MYTPPHFDELRIEVMHDLIRERPLATLVTLGPEGPDANQIPLELFPDERFPLGVLRGHVARANPLWREHPSDATVLAIFLGPQSYISPSWYATKAETGKVVPTWNYTVVHARGLLRVREEPQWIREQIEALTRSQEAAFDSPWSVSDAPADFIDKMIGAVVGIEIEITHLQGKWKASQNQSPSNRDGVVQGLTARGTEEAETMARLIQNHVQKSTS